MLKLRAWHKTYNKMYKVTLIVFPEIGRNGGVNLIDEDGNRALSGEMALTYDYEGNIIDSRPSYFIPLKDVELLEYTGCKDKNSKEIYEGDIVQQKYGGITEKEKTKTANYLVATGWVTIYGEEDVEEKVYGVGCVSRTSKDLFPYDSDFLVIGNIYENPELLK